MTKGKDTRYFSKSINGEVVTQTAHTPGDAVRFVYDGWRDITADVAAAQAAAKQATQVKAGAVGKVPDAAAKR